MWPCDCNVKIGKENTKQRKSDAKIDPNPRSQSDFTMSLLKYTRSRACKIFLTLWPKVNNSPSIIAQSERKMKAFYKYTYIIFQLASFCFFVLIFT